MNNQIKANFIGGNKMRIHKNVLELWIKIKGTEEGCQEWFNKHSKYHSNNSKLMKILEKDICPPVIDYISDGAESRLHKYI
jgi:hypothetical protein